jgi:hypothetical protein
MLLGLIFRESAKTKRSITTRRAEAKGILPTSVDNRPVFVNASPEFVHGIFAGSEKSASEKTQGSHAGYGFGRQGEKAAGLKGFILTQPVESLPRFAPRPSSIASISSRSSVSSAGSSFASHDLPRYNKSAPPPRSDASSIRSASPEPPRFKSSNTAL